MGAYRKENMSIEEKTALEIAAAENAKNKANLDYVAMMADIDIPTENTEVQSND